MKYSIEKSRDLWIGVIALMVITALGIWWLVESSSMSDEGVTAPAASSTVPAEPAAAPVRAAQLPKPIDHSTQSVTAVAEHIAGASEFGSLLASTGVGAALKGDGPFTIFVPTDAAFSQLPIGTITGLSETERLRLVKYHIVVGRAVDPSAQLQGTIQAFSGDALNFNLGADNITLVNSAIVVNAYKAKNGVVYIIDNVLIPPTLNR